MNTDQPYVRHTVPEPDPVQPDAGATTEPSHLAVHGDPSQRQAKPDIARNKSVMWVRPSDLPGMVGSKYARFGIDAQRQVAQSTRRTPGAVATRIRARVSRRAIADLPPTHTTPTRSSVSRERIGL
ncbi:hypothetical protein ACFVJS_20165 [Nocardioides sp. NPDC057772]|uniref:hypothetical protein n=1 Tax=unclassified Nocardioides TaxID=2615069 RepID=UPI0002028B59|nr:hypothetical protein [Nocardioides sp. NBC_00368]EGD42805.1 hypothetical protein NBCG_02939 [Nocardioidaceae bacterium Broad-1]